MAIYSYLPGQKEDYGKGAQTAVAFSGGYLAGILCAIVSHPADVMVSKLNADRQPGESFGGAMGRIYSKIGFGGLWNGLPVRIVSPSFPAPHTCALLTVLSGHDRYAHWSPMDDLRHVQALHGSANDWWRWRSNRKEDCWCNQGLNEYHELRLEGVQGSSFTCHISMPRQAAYILVPPQYLSVSHYVWSV